MQTVQRRSRDKAQPSGVSIYLNETKLQLLEAINRHGFLPTNYIAVFLDRSYQYTRHLMKHTFHEKPRGYTHIVNRPLGQVRTDRKNYNYAIYGITEAGKQVLKDRERYEDTIAPSGEFFHQAMTACVTASIELTARALGITYIPGHIILERSKAKRQKTYRGLMWQHDGITLLPDQMFALKYKDGSIDVFIVECDRGTEQTSATTRSTRTKRKTLEDTYRHYKEFMRHYRSVLGIDYELYVLNVMAKRGTMHNIMDIIPNNDFMCFQCYEDFADPFKTPPILPGLLTEPWLRKGHKPLTIGA